MSGCHPDNEDINLLDTWKDVREISKRLSKLYLFVLGHQLGEKNLANRVQDLETSITDLNQDIIDRSYDYEKYITGLSERVVNLEDQLKSVRKMSTMINDLTHRITGIETLIISHEQYLKKLESNQLVQQLDPKVWQFLHERIDKLEGFNLIARVENLENAFNDLNGRDLELRDRVEQLESKINIVNKIPNITGLINRSIKALQDSEDMKPFKCPVCDGTRICHSKDPGLLWQCQSCEGKGIVWS